MRRKIRAVIRPLDSSDPRNLSHPRHREAWLQLADAIGRLEAREELRLRQQGDADDQEKAESSDLHPILK